MKKEQIKLYQKGIKVNAVDSIPKETNKYKNAYVFAEAAPQMFGGEQPEKLSNN
jgi:hypothetical protein